MTTGKRPSACHVACVVNVQVRNVDDEVVRRLKARAAQRGQNLQGFLAEVLSAEAAVAANDAVLEEAGVDAVLPQTRRGGAAAETAVHRLARLAVEMVPSEMLVDRMWELRENLSGYDAAYVAAAEHLGVELVTADRRPNAAPGLRRGVVLV